jgi:hypothetical protein
VSLGFDGELKSTTYNDIHGKGDPMLGLWAV